MNLKIMYEYKNGDKDCIEIASTDQVIFETESNIKKQLLDNDVDIIKLNNSSFIFKRELREMSFLRLNQN